MTPPIHLMRELSPLYGEFEDELNDHIHTLEAGDCKPMDRPKVMQRARFILAQMETDAYFHPSVKDTVSKKHRVLQEHLEKLDRRSQVDSLGRSKSAAESIKVQLLAQNEYTEELSRGLGSIREQFSSYTLVLVAIKNAIATQRWTARGVLCALFLLNFSLALWKCWKIIRWLGSIFF